MDIRIITEQAQKSEITNCILRELPEWFGIEKSILEYVVGVRDKTLYAAFEGHRCIGFISIKENNRYTAEIYVMGVIPQYHRQGIGRSLYEAAQLHVRNAGYDLFMVKTVGESSDYEPYRRTRDFYLGLGFLPLEEIKELWDASNPCLILVKCMTQGTCILYSK